MGGQRGSRVLRRPPCPSGGLNRGRHRDPPEDERPQCHRPARARGPCWPADADEVVSRRPAVPNRGHHRPGQALGQGLSAFRARPSSPTGFWAIRFRGGELWAAMARPDVPPGYVAHATVGTGSGAREDDRVRRPGPADPDRDRLHRGRAHVGRNPDDPPEERLVASRMVAPAARRGVTSSRRGMRGGLLPRSASDHESTGPAGELN